jgi:hypothetical protein
MKLEKMLKQCELQKKEDEVVEEKHKECKTNKIKRITKGNREWHICKYVHSNRFRVVMVATAM